MAQWDVQFLPIASFFASCHSRLCYNVETNLLFMTTSETRDDGIKARRRRKEAHLWLWESWELVAKRQFGFCGFPCWGKNSQGDEEIPRSVCRPHRWKCFTKLDSNLFKHSWKFLRADTREVLDSSRKLPYLHHRSLEFDFGTLEYS